MTVPTLEKPRELSEELVCQHYWVVESPAGAISKGVCKYCGTVRGFRNSTQDFVWEEERAADLAYWGMRDAPMRLESNDSLG